MKNVLLLLLSLLGFALGHTAYAAPVLFNIPAQDAASALMEFSRQADVDVLYSFRDLQRVQSTAVLGRLEPDEAMALLLKGTGFRGVREGSRRFVVSPQPARTDSGVVTGIILKAGSTMPVADALIRVSGTSLQTRSDYRGRFSLRSVPTGHAIVSVVADRFRALRVDDVGVVANQVTDLGPLSLSEAAEENALEELVVMAEQLDGVSSSGVWALQDFNVTPSTFGMDESAVRSAAMLTQDDLLALPQFGEDLYRSISHLPGLSADDFTARFWVRGAPHDQVLSRLDGVDLIEPFHMKDTDGSLSIVDIESISRLNLYTGGFGAEFGDRAAGVLEMETEADYSYPRRTSVSLSYTGARIAHLGQSTDRRLRWSGALRKGFPKLALEENEEEGDAKISPTYHDLSAKLVYDVNPNNTLSLHLLSSFDEMDLESEGDPALRSKYESNYAWLRWRSRPTAFIEAETVLAYTQTLAARDGAGRIDDRWDAAIAEDRELDQFSLRHQFQIILSDRTLFRAGAEFARGDASYNYRSAHHVGVYDNGALSSRFESRNSRFDLDGERAGAFVSLRHQLTDSLMLETGSRLDRTDSPKSLKASPRTAVAWRNHQTTLRAAWGNYHQSHGIHELSVGDGETRRQAMDRVEHRVLSLEQRLGDSLNLRLEAYQRLHHSPRIHWENVYGTLDTFPELEGDRVRFDPVSAKAEGVEMIVEHRVSPKWSWSASYSLAKSTEKLSDGKVVPRRRDQRHTLYLDVTYTPNPSWLFSATWQYHTGWPVTERLFTALPHGQGQVIWTSRPGEIYGLRLPDYYRLDLRAQRRFLLRASELRVYLDIFNATNRRNLVSYDYELRQVGNAQIVERVSGDRLLPFLPSVGLEWTF